MGGVPTPHSHAGKLTQEVAKFGLVGATGIVVNLVTFNLGRHFVHLPVILASVIATLISIEFNYVGFRYFTYRDRGKRDYTREIVLFLIFSLIGLIIENGILYIATYGFDWDSALQSNIFKFLGIGVATLFRFWSYRTWVFKTVPKGKPDEAHAAKVEVEEVRRRLRPRPAWRKRGHAEVPVSRGRHSPALHRSRAQHEPHTIEKRGCHRRGQESVLLVVLVAEVSGAC